MFETDFTIVTADRLNILPELCIEMKIIKRSLISHSKIQSYGKRPKSGHGKEQPLLHKRISS